MSKTISPIKPWLIQRCKHEDGKFCYDYMGSAEFEWGDQSKALKQLFRGKPSLREVTVQVKDGGASVVVYLITEEGFDVGAYQAHLQALADDELGLLEGIHFDTAVVHKATGKVPEWRYLSNYDIWFDFTDSCKDRNIVLFTLGEQKRADLLARLKQVTDGWSNKVSQKSA